MTNKHRTNSQLQIINQSLNKEVIKASDETSSLNYTLLFTGSKFLQSNEEKIGFRKVE